MCGEWEGLGDKKKGVLEPHFEVDVDVDVKCLTRVASGSIFCVKSDCRLRSKVSFSVYVIMVIPKLFFSLGFFKDRQQILNHIKPTRHSEKQ